MDSQKVVNNIVNMRSAGMKFGTERTRELLDRMGSPDKKLKIVHVAGTNGKGSVCEYLTSVLLAAGKTVGTYTTPEVFCFEEQFRVNGRQDILLCEKYLKNVQAAADGMGDAPTAYERQTAAAFAMFAGEGCEYAVIECCMGGLLDTTNAAQKKVLALITSVSREHTAYLGNTLEEIAAHKAGIISGCPSVISQCVPQEVRHIFYGKGASLCACPCDIEEGDEGTFFSLEGRRYFTKMLGCRQPYNAALAIEGARLIGLDGDAVRAGIAAAFLPGRVQQIESGGKIYILDGAHNPESFIPLSERLKRYAGKRRTLIYGCLSDKDITSSLGMLGRCAENVVAVQPSGYRAMEYEKIFAACRSAFPSARGAASVGEAMENADGEVVAVCGSFTLLKEAKQWIGKGL